MFGRWRLYLTQLPRPSWTVIGILIAAVVEVVILVSVQTSNYLAFTSSQGDLGNYNQAFFTTVHGQGWFYYTTNIPAGSGGSLFAIHFSPFLFLLVPFYALSPSPVTLIALKQIALALGALPLYGIARIYFERRAIPIVFAALYLISPLTLAVDWNNFDPEAFIPLTTLAALYFLLRGRFWWFLAAWILTLSTIESIPALLALFAVGGLVGTFFWPPSSPWLTRAKERRYLLAALVTALAWLGVAYVALIAISPNQGSFGQVYEARYLVLGANSFQDVLPQALLHPWAATAALQYQESQKVLFVEVMILASGAVSVLGGLRYLLPFGGYLALALLSNSTPLYIFGAQYTAYVSALLFVGAIEGTVFLLALFSETSYERRRSDLKNRLEQETRRLTELARGIPLEGVSRAEAVNRLQKAADRVSAGDLPSAALELQGARRILIEVTRGDRGNNFVPGEQMEAAGVRPGLASRIRAWRKPGGAGRVNASELAICIVPIICILVASGLANPLLSNPAAGGYSIAYGEVNPNAFDTNLQSVIDRLPAGGSVLTTNHVFPEVSDRPDAYTISSGEFIVAPTNFSTALNRFVSQSDYVLTDYQIDPTSAVFYRSLGNLSGFGVYAAQDGAYLYERGWTYSAAYFVPWGKTFAGGSLIPTQGNVVSQQVQSSFGPSLYHPAGGNISEKLWSGPNDVAVPPGTYQVTFSFEIRTTNASASVLFRVAESPASVNVAQYATSSLGSHYRVSLVPTKSVNQTILGQSKYAAYDSQLTTSSMTIDFAWSGTGYLDFPAFEESTKMSMYLLGISLVQLSPLA